MMETVKVYSNTVREKQPHWSIFYCCLIQTLTTLNLCDNLIGDSGETLLKKQDKRIQFNLIEMEDFYWKGIVWFYLLLTLFNKIVEFIIAESFYRSDWSWFKEVVRHSRCTQRAKCLGEPTSYVRRRFIWYSGDSKLLCLVARDIYLNTSINIK
jgi:hypothetical protein